MTCQKDSHPWMRKKVIFTDVNSSEMIIKIKKVRQISNEPLSLFIELRTLELCLRKLDVLNGLQTRTTILIRYLSRIDRAVVKMQSGIYVYKMKRKKTFTLNDL